MHEVLLAIQNSEYKKFPCGQRRVAVQTCPLILTVNNITATNLHAHCQFIYNYSWWCFVYLLSIWHQNNWCVQFSWNHVYTFFWPKYVYNKFCRSSVMFSYFSFSCHFKYKNSAHDSVFSLIPCAHINPKTELISIMDYFNSHIYIQFIVMS